MNVDERDEIAAAVAAHGELGARYDSAIAEGLVERIGEEIDKRVEARLGGGRAAPSGRGIAAAFAPPPEPARADPAHPAPRRSYGVTGMILGLGSMGLGVGATAVVTHNAGNGFAQAVMILLIWGAIAFVNLAHSRRLLLACRASLNLATGTTLPVLRLFPARRITDAIIGDGTVLHARAVLSPIIFSGPVSEADTAAE